MGALNQLGSAVSNFVAAPAASVSNAFAQADKDLSLSQNAVPIAALAALAASGGLAGVGIPGLGAAGAGAAGTAAAADLAAAYGATGAGVGVGTLGGIGTAGATPGLLSTAMNFAKTNPELALAGAGLAAKALGGSSTPSSSTTSTSIDPDLKAAYLQQVADARTAAAGLGTRQFEGFTPGYATAEQQLTATGIGGTGQQTTNRAAELALAEAGYTPQQIQAMTGAQYMGAYQNPFEQQVVQGTLADIERQRQISQQAQQARAVGARAFGGSRQAVAESIANEDYMRQAANTAAQLRSAGFTTAAGFGQTDAARAMEAARANAANQIAGAGIRQTAVGQLGALGAQQQNLGMTGAQAVMTAEQQRQQLAQARLDAARNLASERLGLTGSALGQQVPNLGESKTTPIYRNQAVSGLGGALGGAQLGSILGGTANPQYAGYGAILGGLLGLG
ncbi:hypothetical protein UFOVP1016_26 [uncultured Caudovirales phage]|uniref:Uncharacterized protein n=1 Tax=uncultured Caudovirales phage TaxID=2100421 RepID=A0A6J5Q160_9CAUD|nr:hypothetical protein UFOVP1016_26 [uncultured Caudovirales phage]